jgi:carbon storage regulator
MLVLSRRLGERIHIGDGIVVTVVSIRGNQVRLGIDAPPFVRVLRAELRDAELASVAGGPAAKAR